MIQIKFGLHFYEKWKTLTAASVLISLNFEKWKTLTHHGPKSLRSSAGERWELGHECVSNGGRPASEVDEPRPSGPQQPGLLLGQEGVGFSGERRSGGG
jgi:hypothetical protein